MAWKKEVRYFDFTCVSYTLVFHVMQMVFTVEPSKYGTQGHKNANLLFLH